MASERVIAATLCVLISCCMWLQGGFAQSEPSESLRDIIHTVSVDQMILPKILPKSQDFDNITADFWKAIIDILEIDEALKTFKNLTSSAPQVAEEHNINALVLLVEEVKTEACEWLNEVVDGGFTCTDDEFASLKTKFDLYKDLEATADALKEFDGQSC